MSGRYRLIDDGYGTFKKIMNGRKWVGRVCQHADGRHIGIIGPLTIYADTEKSAFREVVSKHLGFSSSSDLLRYNAVTRAHKRAARHALDKVLNKIFPKELLNKI